MTFPSDTAYVTGSYLGLMPFPIRTQIGSKLVSTVLLPSLATLGPRKFESMVFECDEAGKVTDWLELDCERHLTQAEAEAGHLQMVDKWSRKSDGAQDVSE
jgi:hypothetical protein